MRHTSTLLSCSRTWLSVKMMCSNHRGFEWKALPQNFGSCQVREIILFYSNWWLIVGWLIDVSKFHAHVRYSGVDRKIFVGRRVTARNVVVLDVVFLWCNVVDSSPRIQHTRARTLYIHNYGSDRYILGCCNTRLVIFQLNFCSSWSFTIQPPSLAHKSLFLRNRCFHNGKTVHNLCCPFFLLVVSSG